MRQALRRTPLLLAAATLLLLSGLTIAACNSGDAASEDVPAETEDEHSEDEADHAEGNGVVHISMSEWQIGGEHGDETELTADAGDVIFEVHNDGAGEHDFVVMRTDLAADSLPVTDGVPDEKAGDVVARIDPIPGGEIEVMDPVHLEAGRYVVYCSVAGHYDQGMSAELTVS